LPEATEADVEQQQELAGSGTVTPEDVSPDEATEADILEQGGNVTPV
jgi:hypothetical protein